MCIINNCCIILILFNLFDPYLCKWHSYHVSSNYNRREELVINNVISETIFPLDFNATGWKTVTIGTSSYIVGRSGNTLMLSSIETINSVNKTYSILEFQNQVNDFTIFEHWNSTIDQLEPILIIANSQHELLWYRLENGIAVQFWSWSINKNISYINVFQLNYNNHLLLITEHSNQISADIYEFEIKINSNFWLRQTLRLLETANSTAINSYGPTYFLSIPQKSINFLLIYKYINNRFVPYKNISSHRIDQVVSFEIGPKSFLAFTGTHAGIYKFTKNELVEEDIIDFHFEGMQYWLPISITGFGGDEFILVGQRILNHGLHYSFAFEIIMYNGVKFEEHEDISCFYFGEHIETLECLTDGTRMGIIGAAAVKVKESYALLVPRDNHPSELFIFNMTKRTVPNPVEDEIRRFKNEKSRLEVLMEEQKQEYTLLKNRAAKEEISEPEPEDTTEYDNLKKRIGILQKQVEGFKKHMRKVEEFENQSTFETIIFNGLVEATGHLKARTLLTQKIGGEPALDVLQDIVQRNNLQPITGTKILNNYQIDEIVAEKINNISAENLIFEENNTLRLIGDIHINETFIVENNLTAEKVNHLIFQDEIVQFNQDFNVSFQNVSINHFDVNQINEIPIQLMVNNEVEGDIDWNNATMSTLFIPGSIEVTNLNGENFDDFLETLCMRNIETYIPSVIKVLGNVTVTKNATVEYINNFKFPEEFVFADDPTTQITGHKQFENTLRVNKINCNGLINNIDPDDFFTLTTDQNITGKPIFEQLAILESFQHNGTIIGKHVNDFMKNPMLSETNLIKSRVNFKSLEVEGPIYLSGNLNGHDFEEMLNDIIYEDDEEAIITARKQFPGGFSVRGDLNISSNAINDIPLNSLVTKNTEQEMNFNIINGTVTFENLQITGLYNGIDVRKLDEETVKLNGTQYISSTLHFKEKIEVDELHILQTINGLKPEDIMYNNKDQETENTMKFDNIKVDVLKVFGNITGEFDDFDLNEFDKNRLSLTQDQTIDVDYNIEKAAVQSIDAVQINNVKSYELFNADSLKLEILDRLVTGKIQIKNLHVNGSIKVEKINDKDPMNLGGKLWEAGLKKFKKLHFKNDVYFNNLALQNLSNFNFDETVKNIVFKNETNPILHGKKLFHNEIRVKKLIETDQINDIAIENIFTKHGSKRIRGPIEFIGNVHFKNDLKVDEINGLALNLIAENYQVTKEGYRLKGDVIFNRLAHINNLHVDGYLGDRKVQQILDSMVYKDGDIVLPENITFMDKVNIGGNFIHNKINDIDLPEFVSNMVLITTDSEIEGPVRFVDPITIKNKMTTSGTIQSKLVNDIDITTWLDKAIFINRGLLKGNFSFDTVEVVENLQTEFINNIDMNNLILLKADQNISRLSLKNATILTDITVTGSVNGFNLPDEYLNTLTTDSDQEIVANLKFHGNITMENINYLSTLNNNDINKIVTTNTDQNLTGYYNFKAIQSFEQDLEIDGLLNDINITRWYKEGLKLSSSNIQNVEYNWDISGDLILEKDVEGNATVNGLNLRRFKEQMEEKIRHKYEMQRALIDNYQTMCEEVDFVLNRMKKQIYKFDYLEKRQAFHFKKPINYVYNFTIKHTHFLLVNENDDCTSHLLQWDNDEFQPYLDLQMGQINQIVSVPSEKFTLLIVRNKDSDLCEIKGTNVWLFSTDEDPTLIWNMDNQELLQESIVRNRFYGIRKGVVNEFYVTPKQSPKKLRKWEIKQDNMAFVPRGFLTGLALSTGTQLFRLNRNDKLMNFDYNTEIINNSSFTSELNPYLPGRDNQNSVRIQVGNRAGRKNFLAIASYEDARIKSSVDFIKIYENPVKGRLFQKIPAQRPSTPISVNFGNGETLLIFMENESVLQIYEYKGIEGFHHRYAIKIRGTKLFSFSVPTFINSNKKIILGIIDGNQIDFIDFVMLGNQIISNFDCLL